MKTNEQFISDCIKTHGDKYDYSKVDYINSSKKVIIICPDHGEFNPIANNFIRGSNCPKCSNISKIKKLRSTKKEFILKSRKVHGNKYDYSLVEYKGNKTKVKIICGDHIFEQRPGCHLNGDRCGKCHGTHRKELVDVMKIFKRVHGDKYDYSNIEYTNANIKIKIICPDHGEFKQRYSDHSKGVGCPKCCRNYKINTKEFIKKSTLVHGNRYDYSKVKYINSHTKVKIICPDHGAFEQKPYKHSNEEQGCPSCKDSKGVTLICDYLNGNDIKYNREVTLNGCVSKNNIPLRYDFYLPSYDIYIEYDGEQHFYPVKNWGGKKAFKGLQKRDKIKDVFCENNNLKLHRISYMDDVIEVLKSIT